MLLQQISCLPVFEGPEHPTKVIGIIDMVDIVNLVATLHGSTTGWPVELRYGHEWKAWEEATVADALHSKKRDPETVSLDGNLLDAAEVMMRSGLPRILVRNSSETVVNVITQSDIVNALHAQLLTLDSTILARQISSFHRISQGDSLLSLSDWPSTAVRDGKRLVAIEGDKRAIEAFRAMAVEQVSALPVVESSRTHKLLANLSVRDIRDIATETDFPKRLYTQTSLELAEVMHTRRDAHAQNTPLAVSLKPTQTFKDVIETLHMYKIHRVWIVDTEDIVRHVISLTDVLDEVLNY